MKWQMWNGELIEAGPCLGCGFDDPNFVTHSFVSGEKGLISCDHCGTVKRSGHRDAMGNVISVPNSLIGKYSPAIGGVIESAKQLSDHCKKHGLVQTGQPLEKK
jgi:hypothetical protein